MFQKVKFVYNPKAGLIHSPHLVRELIKYSLGKKLAFEYDFVQTEYKGHARDMAACAEADGYDAFVVIGGDGTVNEAATGLLHSQTALGIIPIGSGNGVARGNNIPVGVIRSSQLLLNCQVHTIDAGKIEDKYFFTVCGMGFDAVIGKLFDDQSLRGPLPYFTIGFKEFLFYRPEVFTLRFNGQQKKLRALLVTVANCKQWGNGAIIAPRAEPDDGVLDICVIRKVGFTQALIHLPKLFTGQIESVHKYYQYFKGHALEVERSRPGPFHTDGEPNEGGKVLKVSIVPAALKLIVPKSNRKKSQDTMDEGVPENSAIGKELSLSVPN